MQDHDSNGLVYLNVDDPQLRRELAGVLHASGFELRFGVPDAALPPCILLEEAPPAGEGLRHRVEALGRLPRGRPPLVVVATGRRCQSRVSAMQAGAEDILRWPREAKALASRVGALLRRHDADLDCNPVTGLPGARTLARRLGEAQEAGEQLAAVSFDLRHFKAYNDHYGFARGNCVIRFVADVLLGVADSRGAVYHIGGDDFIVVVARQSAEGLIQDAVEVFAQGIAAHYDAADREAGHIAGTCRHTGDATLFGLLALTVVQTGVGGASPGELDDVASAIARLRAGAKGRVCPADVP